MGLDMYLGKRVTVTKGGKPRQLAYWRKANEIHQWFVDNVQGGEDECKPHSLDSDKLRELLSVVDIVLTAHNKETAEKLLPTQPGFFFGSCEYDECYWSDLRRTKKMLEAILSEPDADMAEYVYQSSW
jgi:hypothetical protein